MTKPYLTIMESHRMAMALCDAADNASRNKKSNDAPYFLKKALEHEKKAAEPFYETIIEPTRSVLYRSAGSIALQLGNKVEAKRLFEIGLHPGHENSVPPEIAEEINGLLKECE